MRKQRRTAKTVHNLTSTTSTPATPSRASTPLSSISKPSPSSPANPSPASPTPTQAALPLHRLYALVSKVATDAAAAATHGDQLIAALSAYLDAQRPYLTALCKKLAALIGDDGREHIDGMRFLDWPSSPNKQGVTAGLQGLLVMLIE